MELILVVAFVLVAGYVYKRKKDKKSKPVEVPTSKPDTVVTPSYPSVATIGGGFLWKPSSESRGGIPALLTPKTWDKKDHISLETATGNTIVVYRIEPAGRTNGDRETYFLWGVSASQLPKNTVLVLDDDRYTIPDPSKRYG